MDQTYQVDSRGSQHPNTTVGLLLGAAGTGFTVEDIRDIAPSSELYRSRATISRRTVGKWLPAEGEADML